MQKINWDAPLCAEFSRKWVKTLRLLLQLKPLSIPRHYLHCVELRNMKVLKIHGFSDASLKGCAAVVYLRVIMSDEIVCNIVASKAKFVPLAARSKKLTVPCLELVGFCYYPRYQNQLFMH